jgi:hypothetical protein
MFLVKGYFVVEGFNAEVKNFMNEGGAVARMRKNYSILLFGLML